MDFHQNPQIAAAFFEAVNDFVLANPGLKLNALSYNSVALLSEQLGRQNQNSTVLTTLSNNSAIQSFLASPSGVAWVDNQSGQAIGGQLGEITASISGTAAGQTILIFRPIRDPLTPQRDLRAIAGVFETVLWVEMASEALVAGADDTVRRMTRRRTVVSRGKWRSSVLREI